MIEKLKMQYLGLDQVAEALDSSEHKIRRWAFDPDPGPPAFLTYAMVGVDELKAETSLEANLQDPLTHLTPDKKVHEQGSATLRNDSAFRTVNETRYQNRKVEELANHTTRGDAVWIVINTTDSREYDARLADFELSAQTLIVLP